MKNAFLVIVYRFFWMFIPVISVFVPLISERHFSMTDFFLLQSFFGFIVIIFEVPSGYMADLYGRKKTLIIGSILSGVGFTYLYFSQSLLDFYIYEALIGISMAMSTGTDFAILFDSVNEELKDPETKKFKVSLKEVEDKTSFWVSHFQSAAMLGEAVSSFMGGFLAFYSLQYNLLATAISGWFPFLVALFVKEPDIKRMKQDSHFKNFKMIISHMFFESLFLRNLIINFLIWSISTMCAVWLIQKHWFDSQLSVFYFGCMWACLSLISSFFSRYAFAIEHKIGLSNVLIASASLVITSYLILPFVGFEMSLFLVTFFYVARGTQSVLYREEMNLKLEPEYRATANSIYSLLFRLVFMVMGPLMGAFIDFSDVKYLFFILGLLYLVLLLLFLIPFNRLIQIEKGA